MKGKIEMLHNDIPRNKFEFTTSVNSKDYFKLADLFAMSIPNGVEIEFKPIEYKCNCDIDKCYTFAFVDNILGFKAKHEVIFNNPATILYKDGKKYVCKCDKEDKFSEELGLALCLLKSFGVSYSDFEKLLKGAKRQGKKDE